jgi:hypothetical protein
LRELQVLLLAAWIISWGWAVYEARHAGLRFAAIVCGMVCVAGIWGLDGILVSQG